MPCEELQVLSLSATLRISLLQSLHTIFSLANFHTSHASTRIIPFGSSQATNESQLSVTGIISPDYT
jgi:hypothetical protein